MKPGQVLSIALFLSSLPGNNAVEFRAGAAILDISPTNFPVIVNAMFTERSASAVVDPLNTRALVLDDSSKRIAIAVVDTCMMPRDLIDAAKQIVVDATGIQGDHILISATHTHSAPSAMGCLGSRADTNYQKFLPPKIAEAIIQANLNLVPAKIGWAVVDDWKHTFNRRWIRRSDRMLKDPFGDENVRAHMHPGHQSPDAIGPSGPVDPALSIIALQTKTGEPLALFANYSQHYYESALLSSDYYGRFANHIAKLIGATNSSFVAMMSQGTSGDLMWMDYSAPARKTGYDNYAREVAEEALRAYKNIQFQDWVPLAMAERKLALNYRSPDAERLTWAHKLAATFPGRIPQTLPEIYALEAIYLHERPHTELILQALRIGDLGITAIPNEVYALTGLKLKAQSPFKTTINIELANGAAGYIPPPEQHKLGGYTTWPARTAGLETQAEPRILAGLLGLLESVAGEPRRPIVVPENPYSKAVNASKPISYWRFDDMAPRPEFEDGIALYLPGMGESKTNHAIHFAGGRVHEKLPNLGANYSAHFWIWNGLPNDARDVTGYFFSRGANLDAQANGDHLGIGGKHLNAEGKLILFNGNRLNNVLIGKSVLSEKTWWHVAIVREGSHARVYLDGYLEIEGELPLSLNSPSAEIFLGGRNDRYAGFEGKMDEAAIYDRALTQAEILDLVTASGVNSESKPLTAQQSLQKIHLAPGFQVDLVVAEPLVLDPVAMDWDFTGRLWVVEMADYPLGMDGKGKPGGRVRVIEDSDGDGKYDRSVIFVEGLNFPTGIITWRDGVIVTAAPEILFFKDTDSDGRADIRQVLYSGFLEGNQQLRINGLRYGLDNWIYCAVGGHYRGYGAATKIKSHLTGQQVALGSRDFRFRPDTGEFEPESGPSQFGRNRDDWGHWFGTQNSNPLWHYVLPDRYLRRNPHLASPDPTHQVVTPVNPKIYPASAPEKRYHSYEHGDHFTSACAGMIYRDNLLFPGSEMHEFTCEPFHNMVHHEIVTDAGVTFDAHRAPAEQMSEFFASEDRWCRPVMTRTGPDGALWVVDMYRYMIEHPDWLPENGRAELLPHYRKGDDKGRIYRVFPTNVTPRKPLRLDKLSTAELVAALDSSNEWQRDKAQQLLLWKKDPAAIEPLKKLAQSKNPLARLHALCTMEGFKVLTPEILKIALHDEHPGIRENALRMSESFSFQGVTIDGRSSKVRLQLAFSLGEWKSPDAGEALAKLAIQNYNEPFILAAVMSSAIPHIETLSRELAAEKGPALKVYSEALYTLCLALDRKDLLQALLDPVVNAKNFTADHFNQYATYLQLLARRKLPAPDHPGILDAARKALEGPDRFAAACLLAHFPSERAVALPILADSLAPGMPMEDQRAAIASLTETGDDSAPHLLLRNWSNHSPNTRAAILEALLPREPWTFELLQKIQPAEIDVARRNRLLKHESARIRELAEKMFKSASSNRAQVIEQFRPALDLNGNAAQGKVIYAKVCIICHQRDNQGNEIGPDLRSVVEHTAEKLLANILDPNADIQPGYHAYTCELTSGEHLYGLIAAETGNSIVMKFPDGAKRTILRSEIKSLQASNRSLMPEGLENGLTKQGMADLIAYLRGR
jgi:putative membrane-bound dehydrogenase-like protein